MLFDQALANALAALHAQQRDDFIAAVRVAQGEFKKDFGMVAILEALIDQFPSTEAEETLKALQAYRRGPRAGSGAQR